MIVYTVIFNEYDTLKDPTVVEEGTKYFVFSETEQKSDIWTWIPTNLTSIKDQRMFKILAFMWFADPETLYIDGSIQIVCRPDQWLGENIEWTDDLDFIGLEHREFDCIFDEADIITERGRVGLAEISAQMSHYRKVMPKNHGLIKTGWIYRRRTERVVSFCHNWWLQVKEFSHRDQLAWGYLAYVHGLQYTVLPYNDFRQAFKLYDHERNLMINLMTKK